MALPIEFLKMLDEWIQSDSDIRMQNRDDRWLQVANQPDDVMDSLIVKLEKMTHIVKQRVLVGSQIIQQRVSTDFALGTLAVLSTDLRQRILQLASDRLGQYRNISAVSSAFRQHAEDLYKSKGFWQMHIQTRLFKECLESFDSPPCTAIDFKLILRQQEDLDRPPSESLFAEPLRMPYDHFRFMSDLNMRTRDFIT